MEHARLLIAIVLSFLVFFLWELFFVDQEAVKPPPQQQSQKETLPGPETGPAVTPEPEGGETLQPQQRQAETLLPAEGTGATEPETPIIPLRKITVETPLYTVEISEKGAAFTSFRLHEYKETVEKDSPPKELVPAAAGRTLYTRFENGTAAPLADARFIADTRQDRISAVGRPRELAFTWQSSEGLTVQKVFRFSPDTYLIGMKISVKNLTELPLNAPLAIGLAGNREDSGSYAFEGLSTLKDNDLEQIRPKDIKGEQTLAGEIQWIASETQYFIAAILPDQPVAAKMHLAEKEIGIAGEYITPPRAVPAGGSQTYDFHLYFGPKSLSILNGINNQLARAIDFGWFDFLAKPSLWVMNFLYGFIPNYGIAIIILTTMIKLILWPLGNKGYKSMNEMKKLQPEMTRIRDKYKDDKKKMNEEMMGLYKTYKINPMGGCLPMILQIPVFIALYRMLYEAIELRHAPFFLWINDLSAPDRLFNFDVGYIPLMQPPYGIPVLTIIMGATMFFQQKMSPPPGDPTQAKMMTFLPIVFTFIFINFPSGLVLYWMVNNVLSIAQQYYISKKQA